MRRQKSFLIAVASLAAGSLFAAVPAHAAARYAEAASSDQIGSCSSLQPCRLDHAVNDAAAGDVVVVRPGDYDVTYALKATATIAIRGVPGESRPRLVGGASANGAVLAMPNGGSVS